ncbi:MAG: hypothetical protein J6O17_04740 [Eubacterium sp.]|nr:hypothetical protein [Eubacterium sp.]
MKNKKWAVIAIVSFIIIAFEVAAALLFIIPGMNKNKMFEALREGKGEAAADYYDKVRFFAAQDIEKDIKGFMVTEANSYLTGETSYEEYISHIRAVDKIPDFKGSSLDCVKTTNLVQLIDLYEKGFTDKILNEGENLFDIWDEFDDVYNAYDKKGISLIDSYGNKADEYYAYIDKGLEDHLKEKYDAYKAGKLDATAIIAYVDVAYEFFPNDSDFLDRVDEELSMIETE